MDPNVIKLLMRVTYVETVQCHNYLSKLASHQLYAEDFQDVGLHDKIRIPKAGKVNSILQPTR
jgi:hypothetical protein